jgi:hypothetical protein
MSRMSWRWLHDCFVYLLHRALTRHEVALDFAWEPAKPICKTCGR